VAFLPSGRFDRAILGPDEPPALAGSMLDVRGSSSVIELEQLNRMSPQ
jgi:hypothetical protein